MKSGAGKFTKKIPVTTPGSYDVDFKDATGYVGKVTFEVTGAVTQEQTIVPTTTAVVRTTRPFTTAPTPWPTATQSPLSPLTVLCAAGLAGMLVVLVRRNNN
jgi:hypothetical protein